MRLQQYMRSSRLVDFLNFVYFSIIQGGGNNSVLQANFKGRRNNHNQTSNLDSYEEWEQYPIGNKSLVIMSKKKSNHIHHQKELNVQSPCLSGSCVAGRSECRGVALRRRTCRRRRRSTVTAGAAAWPRAAARRCRALGGTDTPGVASPLREHTKVTTVL